jgi:hypothetical protein
MGVYANDALKAPKRGCGYILNLQNVNEPGSHWTAFYDGSYFDSYGVPPTLKIARFTKKYNTLQYQSFDQESCGFHAVYVLKNIFAGREPYHGMIPGKYQHNERVLKKFFF